jgi:hypothetical protein
MFYEDVLKKEAQTPLEKLWRFLAERHGQEVANEAHLYFNEQKRIYEQRRISLRSLRKNRH